MSSASHTDRTAAPLPAGPPRAARHRSARRAVVSLVALLALLLGACGSDGDDAASPATTTPPPGGGTEDELPADVTDQLAAALTATMEANDVPAAVVGVWVPGEGSWTTVAGEADLATGDPATAAMTWPVRSITKSFTVTILLQLVDEGAVSLDDTVSQYVEGAPNGDRITLRQLANMSSGLPEYTTEAFIDDFLDDPDRVFTLDELNAYAFAEAPQFEPGERAVYTNTNTNVIGSVIEAVTGRSFTDVLSERILAPEQLSGTTYPPGGGPWPEPHATGYQPDEGELSAQPDNLSIFGPAGGIVSTLDDQRAWGELLATGALLDPATQDERLDAHPLEKGPEYDAYGLGIGEIEGWWGHTGEGFGFTALTMHDVDTGATVVVFMNYAQPGTGEHLPTALFREIVGVLDSSS